MNENFLLVGILEELEDVLLLLERFLPHYFKGVLSIYKDPGNPTHTQALPGEVCLFSRLMHLEKDLGMEAWHDLCVAEGQFPWLAEEGENCELLVLKP